MYKNVSCHYYRWQFHLLFEVMRFAFAILLSCFTLVLALDQDRVILPVENQDYEILVKPAAPYQKIENALSNRGMYHF